MKESNLFLHKKSKMQRHWLHEITSINFFKYHMYFQFTTRVTEA